MPSASRDLRDRRAISARLVGVHAGDRLVEQQQRRLGAQRAGELDALAVAVRKVADAQASSLAAQTDSSAMPSTIRVCSASSRRAPGSRRPAVTKPALE